ncbi:transposon Tf2-3 polyprotein [Batrachochytrium salamandrivorans]|nr:transposon Tf2-3 polyprotein [Batrachochytrium salamandrivorans]
MQSDVYPFVEVSPVSDASVPSDILSSFSSLFSEDQAETLPPHRDFDCSIELKPGSEPFHGKIYQLTREEDKVMQEWIQDNLRKGFIRNSSSPHGAPCFFVKQKDKLRLCMDYRGLNKNTVKDRNPIPLISELLRTLSTGKIFTTLDLRGAYNLLCIKEGDESKTSFITKYGQFEFLVMPFGLANAPAQFQRMMNSLFRDVIGKHVLVYLDDIVIYSDNMSDHIVQVHNVLRVLQDNGLYCKAEKCHFYKSEIKYLGYIISADGLRMDPSKISAVQSWPTPKKVRDLQVLLGFTNFYRALIHDYSSMTANLTKLFKKDAPFVWGPEQEKSLQDLKTAFANSDFLTHPDDSRAVYLGDRCIRLCNIRCTQPV